ncbi:flavin reductase family protein [Streptomyces sp. NPDC004270]
MPYAALQTSLKLKGEPDEVGGVGRDVPAGARGAVRFGRDHRRLRLVRVTAPCALEGGSPVAIAASTFTPASLSPSLVSACVQGGSAMWPRLREPGRLGVSALAEGQHAICRSPAGRSSSPATNGKPPTTQLRAEPDLAPQVFHGSCRPSDDGCPLEARPPPRAPDPRGISLGADVMQDAGVNRPRGVRPLPP